MEGTWFEEIKSASLIILSLFVSSLAIMTFLSFVLLSLAPCLVLPGILVAFLSGTRSQSTTREEMGTVLKGLRADVRQLDLDAREQAWRRANWSGPASYVANRITESSHEVMVLTSYAEASVSLASADGNEENRRCSLCLN